MYVVNVYKTTSHSYHSAPFKKGLTAAEQQPWIFGQMDITKSVMCVSHWITSGRTGLSEEERFTHQFSF